MIKAVLANLDGLPEAVAAEYSKDSNKPAKR